MQDRPGNPSGFRARLTDWGCEAIHEGVKACFPAKIAGLLLMAACPAFSQPPGVAPLPGLPVEPQGNLSQLAPPEVLQSARSAVADLGKQVVLGRYQYAIEKMNPLWKERMAARKGGIAAVERELAGVSERMVQQGITITDFQPRGNPSSYEVGPGKRVDVVGGQQVENLIYTKWLVLVPTLTKIRVFPQGSPKPIEIEITGFQVAISDKGRNEWTFIDGSSLTQGDLRQLFINLPQDMVLPPIEKREAR